MQEQIGNHFRNILSWHISTFWNSMFLTFFGPIKPPKKLNSYRLWKSFSWNSSWQPIILTKWEIISKSEWKQNIFEKYALCVHEPGMWWNLDILTYCPKDLMTNCFFCVFWWSNFKSSIILTKWEIISKS